MNGPSKTMGLAIIFFQFHWSYSLIVFAIMCFTVSIFLQGSLTVFSLIRKAKKVLKYHFVVVVVFLINNV